MSKLEGLFMVLLFLAVSFLIAIPALTAGWVIMGFAKLRERWWRT